MANNLISIMLKKEGKHWKAMKLLYKEMTDIGAKIISYPILVILISFFHYLFSSMHFLFESYLYLFNRKQFSKNLITLNKKLS